MTSMAPPMALKIWSVTQLRPSMIKSSTLHRNLTGQMSPHTVQPQQPQRGAHQHTLKHLVFVFWCVWVSVKNKKEKNTSTAAPCRRDTTQKQRSHQSAGHLMLSKKETAALMAGPSASATGLKGLITAS